MERRKQRKMKHNTAVRFITISTKLKKKNRGVSPRANYTDKRPPLVGEVSAKIFADRRCHVVGVTNPYGRILGFLDRIRNFFFQVAPQL
jgi:hypothetical protein